MGYPRRRSFSLKKLLIPLLVLIIGAGIWYFSTGDGGEDDLVDLLNSPEESKGPYSEWRSRLKAGESRAVAKDVLSAIEKGDVKSHPELLWIVAEAWGKAGEEALRRSALEKIIVEFPESVAATRARSELSTTTSGDGIALYLDGKYEAAKTALAVQLEKSPEEEKSSILWHIARCEQELGQARLAREHFKRVLNDYGDSLFVADSYFGLALSEFSEGRYDSALEYFDKGRAADRTSAFGLRSAKDMHELLYVKLVEDEKSHSMWEPLREMLCVLWDAADEDERTTLEQKLDEINSYVVFNPNAEFADAVFHTVETGDSIGKIAQKYDSRVRLIKHINGLDSDMIYPDQRLKVLVGNSKLIVDKSAFRLKLLFNGKYVHSYEIGIGKDGKDETPVGEFRVKTLEVDPIWYFEGEKILPDDPRNVLGTRWIGLDIPSYGIHGTPFEDSLGKKSSAGCVRMLNQAVEEVYAFVKRDDVVVIRD
ncbi:MAG: L,D-transpeptidase family protein [Planctomycetota bacterium]|nr:L,D-transpeptidase family protein [Planctomycetota bacterium]